MKNRIVRAVCASLVFLMLVGALSSCGNAKTTETNPPISNVTLEKEELVLPENSRFDGETYSVLSAGNQVYNDFDYDEDSESVLEQAQYKRKTVIMQENGVEIELKMIVDKASYGNGPGFMEISRAVTAEDVVYHLGLIGGYDAANLAATSNLYDINSVPWVETSKSWWDQNANQDLTINGMLFFTNGSLTAAYSESTFVIYINNELAKTALKDVDVYQTVRDGKWTVDKLGEWSRTVTNDLDGDGYQTYKDRFGLYVWDDSIMGMMGASGTKVATIEEDGTISLTLDSARGREMFAAFTEIAYSHEYALTYQRFTNMFNVVNAFQEDKALLWATSNTNTAKIREMDSSFGILPYPKLSEEQERYYSTIAPYNSQFLCIPYMEDSDALNFVGVITESLAYYGKSITWPACYEHTLKGAFARDDGTLDMLDIIYSNYIYDIGYYYQIGMYHDGLMNLIRNKQNTFSSMYEGARNSAQTKISQLNDFYKAAVNEWHSEN